MQKNACFVNIDPKLFLIKVSPFITFFGDFNVVFNYLQDSFILTSYTSKIQILLFSAAEVRVYRELTKITDGTFAVTLDDVHLRDLLHEHLEPPPSASGTEPALIKMGFPSHASADSSSLGLCMCHLNNLNGKLTTSGFLCPQVCTKTCSITET